jgi:uncharacterized protein
MKVEFDPGKDAANVEKHATPLAFATSVLADPVRLDVLDVRVDYAEERYVSYGAVEGRVWVCVFTMRDEVNRIISGRKANDRETRRYHDTSR